MSESKYKSMLRHGDIKKIMQLTGYSRYVILTRLSNNDWEMNEIVKTYFDKKIELLKLNLTNGLSENTN